MIEQFDNFYRIGSAEISGICYELWCKKYNNGINMELWFVSEGLTKKKIKQNFSYVEEFNPLG